MCVFSKSWPEITFWNTDIETETWFMSSLISVFSMFFCWFFFWMCRGGCLFANGQHLFVENKEIRGLWPCLPWCTLGTWAWLQQWLANRRHLSSLHWLRQNRHKRQIRNFRKCNVEEGDSCSYGFGLNLVQELYSSILRSIKYWKLKLIVLRFVARRIFPQHTW